MSAEKQKVEATSVTSPVSRKWLRRENRRLRYKKGAYKLRMVRPLRSAPSVRRDVVAACLRQRDWRLALTVAVMPHGWSLERLPLTTSPKSSPTASERSAAGGGDRHE